MDLDLNHLNPQALAIGGLLLVALGLALWAFIERRQSKKLKSKFGPEYHRAVSERGDRSSAESELMRRTKRMDSLSLRTLHMDERLRFADAWRADKERFVENPAVAVEKADALLQELMICLGYPMADFQQRLADLSVDHPRVVEHYRIAHEISLRNRRGEGTTEELRRAMVSYRILFDELLEHRSDLRLHLAR